MCVCVCVQALIGGHQAPTDIGRVGAAKGVGSMTGKPATAAPAAAKSGAGAAGAAGDKVRTRTVVCAAVYRPRLVRMHYALVADVMSVYMCVFVLFVLCACVAALTHPCFCVCSLCACVRCRESGKRRS